MDLSTVNTLYFHIRSNRTGNNLRLRLYNTNTDVWLEYEPIIGVADTWQQEVWDLSGETGEDKDSIDKIQILITNDEDANEFYIDNFYYITLNRRRSIVVAMA